MYRRTVQFCVGVVELLIQKVTTHYNIIYEARSGYACGTKLVSPLGCRGTCMFLDSPQVLQRSQKPRGHRSNHMLRS